MYYNYTDPAGTFLFVLETMRAIIYINSRYCCPYCSLPIEKVSAVHVSVY